MKGGGKEVFPSLLRDCCVLKITFPRHYLFSSCVIIEDMYKNSRTYTYTLIFERHLFLLSINLK